MSLVAQERATYDAIWSTVQGYRDHSPGLQNVDRFLEMSGAFSGTLMDAGCGAGVAGLELARRGFDVRLCDVTRSGLDGNPLPFTEVCLWHDVASQVGVSDYVYCCDVMEHVPTEYTMLVLSRLWDATAKGAFFSISLVHDAFGVWVGKPLHQTVRPFTWWRDRLAEFGTVVEARDCLNAGLYWVTR